MKRMKKHWVKRVGTLVLSTILLAAPAYATVGGGTVGDTNGGGLNLRKEASTTAGVQEVLDEGSFLLVEEKLDGWYKVVHDGVAGYVCSDYVDFSETLDGDFDFTASTNGTSVNIRKSASTDAGVVKVLYDSGSKLCILGVSGNWLHVQDEGGTEGYIRSDLLRYTGARPSALPAAPTVATATQAAAPVATQASGSGSVSSTGSQLAQTALLYKGYRYTWGGTSPSTGFDCSGFVNYIYGLYGYKLERVAQSIYNTNGRLITDRSQLLPGDILCFGWSPYSINHVGIYVGNNQMIHASTSRTGVIVSSIVDSYYTSRFVGAKRVL